MNKADLDICISQNIKNYFTQMYKHFIRDNYNLINLCFCGLSCPPNHIIPIHFTLDPMGHCALCTHPAVDLLNLRAAGEGLSHAHGELKHHVDGLAPAATAALLRGPDRCRRPIAEVNLAAEMEQVRSVRSGQAGRGGKFRAGWTRRDSE